MTRLSLDDRLMLSRHDPEFTPQSRTGLRAIIRLRLWTLAQRRLFDPRATRRLASSNGSRASLLHEADTDFMLEENKPSDLNFALGSSVDESADRTESLRLDRPVNDPCLCLEDEDFLLDQESVSDDDLLDLDEDFEPDEDMLDSILLGVETNGEPGEGSAFENNIFQDNDEFEEILKESTVESSTEDADEDLFQDPEAGICAPVTRSALRYHILHADLA